MKKIFHFNLLVALTLLVIGCVENKNATAKEGVNLNTTPTENVETETKLQEKKSQIIVSKTDPPKYANKAEVIEFLIEKLNKSNPKAPLTNEQIDQINALAESSRITTFKDQYACSIFKRKMVQRIKSKVLTPEQLLLFPRKSKTKK
ncbi:hypothetical protein [Dokdonia sp.]|uniref:hypothetical protein n=1 Tax=Dokdonia sp. TaxID=2024995 RepID=UPI003264756A